MARVSVVESVSEASQCTVFSFRPVRSSRLWSGQTMGSGLARNRGVVECRAKEILHPAPISNHPMIAGR